MSVIYYRDRAKPSQLTHSDQWENISETMNGLSAQTDSPEINGIELEFGALVPERELKHREMG